MSHNTLTGARAIFRINGEKIAYASGVEIGEEFNHEPVEVLDNVEVQEHAPVGYRVSFSAQIFRTVKGTIGALAPRSGVLGSVKEMGIAPKVGRDPLALLTSGLMTCTIQDRLTKKIIAQVEQVKCSTSNMSITARGVVGNNVSFVAVRVKDESEVA